MLNHLFSFCTAFPQAFAFFHFGCVKENHVSQNRLTAAKYRGLDLKLAN